MSSGGVAKGRASLLHLEVIGRLESAGRGRSATAIIGRAFLHKMERRLAMLTVIGFEINWLSDFAIDLTVANARDIVKMDTTAGKPLFHVILSDRDEWLIEAEWPDGTLEPVSTFKDHASAVNWISTRSETWDRTSVRRAMRR